eukprot:354058-Chlamydomonas_euryale.AAC.6
MPRPLRADCRPRSFCPAPATHVGDCQDIPSTLHRLDGGAGGAHQRSQAAARAEAQVGRCLRSRVEGFVRSRGQWAVFRV